MDAEYWEIALHQALHQIELECLEQNKKSNTKCKPDKSSGYFELLSVVDDDLLRCDLLESTNSPIIASNTDMKRRRRQGVVEKQRLDTHRCRKIGVAERNETEREVVYRTLRNFIKLNRLHNYNMF